MATGFDKLVKNLAKRKRSAPQDEATAGNRSSTSSSASTAGSSHSAHSDSVTFPQPSYLRPKSSRMLARDESSLSPNADRRARNVSGPHGTPGRESVTSSTDSVQPLQSPSRRPDPTDRPSYRLFPIPSPQVEGQVANAKVPKLLGLPRLRLPESLLCEPRSPAVERPDTPPPSASEEDFPRLGEEVVSKGIPTPAQSPRLAPRLATKPGSAVRTSQSLDLDIDEKEGRLSRLRKTQSDSLLSETLRSSPTILKEPSMTDFLNLSDDDIADDITEHQPLAYEHRQVASVASVHHEHQPSSPCSDISSEPLLTLSAPLSIQPANNLAAIAAARIAARFAFDLVYVVQLRPDNNIISDSHPLCFQPAVLSPPIQGLHTPYSRNPDSREAQHRVTCVVPRLGMTGRLLAAYGLSKLMSPLRISTLIHLKVLRSDGWVEYVNENPKQGEFSHGYSCAFHVGHTSNGSYVPKGAGITPERQAQQTSPRMKALANRGIVFAAYRLPRNDVPQTSDAEMLGALRKEAGAMLDMVLDNRPAQRRPKGPRADGHQASTVWRQD